MGREMARERWVQSVLSSVPAADGSVITPAPDQNRTAQGAPSHSVGSSSTSAKATPRESERPALAEARLEHLQRLDKAIDSVEVQIVSIERDIEDVQETIANGGIHRGKKGDALVKEEERLVRKEQQLRDKEKQLRDENIAVLQSIPNIGNNPFSNASLGDLQVAPPQQRMSLVMTSAFVDDPEEEKQEQQRLTRVGELIKERRRSVSTMVGDLAGTDTVANVYKLEEDSRLLVRLASFEMPILVSTLTSGFTLVLFDVAETQLAQQLAILSFGLEVSSSTVLSLVSFRGQQLYSHATDLKPLTRTYLRKMCPVTLFALGAFAAGLVTFVVAFVVEASDDLGSPWMAVIGLVFSPSVFGGLLFLVSTAQVRRHSVPLPPARQ